MSAKYQIVNDLPQSIFRTYDVRGIVEESLNDNIVYTIGLAIGSEAQALAQQTVVIARDGRLSGPNLLAALKQGLQDTGCDVIDIGAVPTPVLYFATYHFNTRSGVMLTGSHNPVNYNGLKIVLAERTLAEDRIQSLYQRCINNDFCSGQGDYQSVDIADEYINRITSDVKLNKPLKIVIDAGNGITGMIAPELYKRLGCDVIELYTEVDGNFPNHHPDPTVLENLAEVIDTVKSQQADIGLAFDGDGDRVGVVSNTGDVIFSDRQLMLFAIDILSRQPGATIVYDVKSTKNLETVISDHGGEPLLYKTGHSLIKGKMQSLENCPIAGEMSGHIFFKERWYGFDDGMYVGARLLEIMTKSNSSCDDLFNQLPDSTSTPELKIAIDDSAKYEFMQEFIAQAKFPNADKITIDGLRVEYDTGWGLIRPSNTTPYLTLRFEADSDADLNHIKEIFIKEIHKIDPDLALETEVKHG